LAPVAPIDVPVTEVPGALDAFSGCFMRTAWRNAFHGEDPVRRRKDRSIGNIPT
jgi:hypothetical protein